MTDAAGHPALTPVVDSRSMRGAAARVAIMPALAAGQLYEDLVPNEAVGSRNRQTTGATRP